MKRCECEHHSHFTQPDGMDGFEPPTGHTYFTPADDTEMVQTQHGPYSLCKPCREAGHMTDIQT